MNTINPGRAVTADELREYLRRDRLELYIIIHLADGLRPKMVMSNHAQHARFNWLKDRVKDGRLPARLDGGEVNVKASVIYHDLARVIDEDAPEPLIAFLPKWGGGHKPSPPAGQPNIPAKPVEIVGGTDTVTPTDAEAAIQTMAPAHDVSTPSVAEDIEQYKTGLPGRGTIAHLIIREFERRLAADECQAPLAAEARALRDWASVKHRKAPTPTPRTIENQIRAKYRACMK
jgi:hypothetical protein